MLGYGTMHTRAIRSTCYAVPVLTNAGREYMKVAMDATSALKRRKKKECEELRHDSQLYGMSC